ncbi:MAG: chorismate mutase [Clostridiales bacterium]|nr:chorismate mutase [Clostridiales bacterium]
MSIVIEQIREEINLIDREMASLFVRRMRAVEKVAAYKKERGIQVFDAKREKQILENSESLIDDPDLREYYRRFMTENMNISKDYQHKLIEKA